jgi:hypothetical protein
MPIFIRCGCQVTDSNTVLVRGIPRCRACHEKRFATPTFRCGHPKTEENTKRVKGNRSRCRTCRNAKDRSLWAQGRMRRPKHSERFCASCNTPRHGGCAKPCLRETSAREDAKPCVCGSAWSVSWPKTLYSVGPASWDTWIGER